MWWKTQREERLKELEEVTIIAVIADGGMEIKACTNDSRKACSSFLLLFHGLQDTLVLSCPILHRGFTLSSEDLVTFLLIPRNFQLQFPFQKS
jgi:hypothetical protein